MMAQPGRLSADGDSLRRRNPDGRAVLTAAVRIDPEVSAEKHGKYSTGLCPRPDGGSLSGTVR